MPALAAHAQPPPDLDLAVRYIHRTPEIDYVYGSTAPDVEGWPEVGQEVSWQAIVKNWALADYEAVGYQWLLDGVVVADGTIDVPAQAEVTVEYPWTWTFDRHELTFDLDPANEVDEFSEANNQLLIHTDAITIGFYVEQGFYDYFHEHQHKLGIGSNGFDDWAQRHVRLWNEMLADAVFPETPNGVLDRVRLDRITLVPNDALPLVKTVHIGNATYTNPHGAIIPNGDDLTVDMQWGFPTSELQWGLYEDHETVGIRNNPFYFHGAALHELGHARALIDVYGYNVEHEIDGNQILIQENGASVVDTPYMPARKVRVYDVIFGEREGYSVYRTAMQGLMNSEWWYMDRFSAAAMNRMAGHRAIAGNFNPPQNLGAFLNDLPSENRLTIKDQAGNVLAGARVAVYQSDPKAVTNPGGNFDKHYDDIPDIERVADAEGRVLLGRNPFSPDKINHGAGGSNAILIIRVEHEGHVGYGFLESMAFNLQYWSGNTEMGTYELEVNLVDPVSVAAEDEAEVPERVTLGSNYPNPFAVSTTIPLELPERRSVTLKVFDVRGREVASLLEGSDFPAGLHQALWKPDAVPRGLYFYQLEAGDLVIRKAMLYLR